MKQPVPRRFSAFGRVILGLLLLSRYPPIRFMRPDDDDHDRRWREHERREAEWRAHEHREHWDHRYWDYDRYRDDPEVYVYRPPPVYYAPPPPSGLDFVFRLGH